MSPLRPSPPSLRPALLADAPAVAAVHVEGWRWGYRTLLPAALLEGLSLAGREGLWRKLLGPESTTRVLVAEGGLGVVAFAAWGPPRGDLGGATAELYALYQREACAGTGVGRALLQAVTAAMQSDGHRRAALWVLEANGRARAFYERHGWRPDGGSATDVLDGVTLVEVRHALALPAD